MFLLRLRFLSSTGVLDAIAAEFGRFENVEELETLPAEEDLPVPRSACDVTMSVERIVRVLFWFFAL